MAALPSQRWQLITDRGLKGAPATGWEGEQKKKTMDYAFQRQFNEKLSTISGCPGDGRDKGMRDRGVTCSE